MDAVFVSPTSGPLAAREASSSSLPAVGTVAWSRPVSGRGHDHGADVEWKQTVILKATFDLSPQTMRISAYQAPLVREEKRAAAGSSLLCPNDLEPFKKRVDVTVVGSCFAPDPRRSLSVRLATGSVDKQLVVCGPRNWASGGAEEPQPFDQLELRYELAAGGPGTSNPVGISGSDARVPQVLHPSDDPPRQGERIKPIGLGPVPFDWPQRRVQLRGLVSSWSPERWFDAPLPLDIDDAFFNCAPVDQQLSQLDPDQLFVLEHLHPRHSRLETRLPNLSAFAFVERSSGPPEALSMRADTVWIDTDRSLCVVTWRGQLKLQPHDDAQRVLVSLTRSVDELPIDGVQETRTASRTTPPPLPSQRRAPAPKPRAKRLSQEKTAPHSRPSPALSSQPDLGHVSPASAASAASSIASGDDHTELFANTQSLPGDARLEDYLSDTGELSQLLEEHTRDDPAPAMTAKTSPQRMLEPLDDPPTSTGLFLPSEELDDKAPAWLRAAAQRGGPPSVPGAPPSSVEARSVRRSAPPPPPSSTAAPPLPQPAPIPKPIVPPSAATTPLPAPAPKPIVPPSVAATPPATPPHVPDVDAGHLRTGGPAPQGAPSVPMASPTAGYVRSADNAAAAGGPGQAKKRRGASSEITELLWFDETVASRLRSRWADLINDLEFEPEDPLHDRDEIDPALARKHHLVFGVLTRGEAEPISDLRSIMKASVNEAGRFTPPLVIVSGDMGFPFSDVDRLLAMASAMKPLSKKDPPLAELIEEVEALADSPLLTGEPELADQLLSQLRQTFKNGKRTRPLSSLESSVERVLLEERKYQRRAVFGGPHLRTVLRPSMDQGAAVAYLPEDVAAKLPLVTQMRTRVLAEAHVPQDQYESHAVALRVLGLGRVIRFDAN